MQSVLKKFTEQAKRLSNLDSEQAKKEKEQLINKLFRLGLVKKNAGMDDVLSLTLENILDRRLQTMVYKLNMANIEVKLVIYNSFLECLKLIVAKNTKR